MARRRKDKSNDDKEARKKRVRSFRNRERRERRADAPTETSGLSSLRGHIARMAAFRVLNVSISSYWPFWLSVPSEGKHRNPPTADYYPCKTVIRGNRVWYAFMFREHRDEQCSLWSDARKELTPDQ